jgi:subtilisin-like proprotein convertase family protein
MRKLFPAGILLALSSLALGCAPDDGSGDEITNQDGDAWLSDRDSLYQGWPTNEKLPDEGKADAVYPLEYTDIVAHQSPVRNQARRGVCSIFSAVGLMEHLYVKEGTIASPDFSEEFLQWSVKVEVGAFADTEGSSSYYNLRALNQFGIVSEGEWPYLGRQWTTSDDAACTGETQPTRCWTHGDPPASALSAHRWKLPAGRWVSSLRNNIKAHMVEHKEGVVVGGTFFYQSWNHRLSELPTNNAYWRAGYVTYPNADDIQKSNAKPAGHSFVLVGWDDELVVQKRDKDGNLVVDQNQNPVMEKGFWLFKNSWGTDSFGVENEHGAGYGWISMQYVEDYLTAYVSSMPEVDVAEVCGNETDDDFDGAIDCDDSDCGDDGACGGGSHVYVNDQDMAIPDNQPSGITSEIVVADGGVIDALKVNVDISHSYKGDLRVKLVRQGTEVVLHDRKGGGEDDLKATFVVENFNGEDAAGTWKLVVSDHAGTDVGKLNGWSLEIVTGDAAPSDLFESNVQVAIPDNNPAGASSTLDVTGADIIGGLKVRVSIDHSYKGDLLVKLVRNGGEIVLQSADGSSGPFGTKSYTVADLNGQDPNGSWSLVVIDTAAVDVGTLTGWSLEILH